jgi:HEPN domain-containing protein
MRKSAEEEGKRWLEQAEEDLKWAGYLAQGGGYYLSCFLAQQVGEKALKAYLYAQGEEIVLGHSIGKLCERAGEFDSHFLEKRSKWSILDSYYTTTRYPNGLPEDIPARVYNKEAAQTALALASEIVEVVKRRLK